MAYNYAVALFLVNNYKLQFNYSVLTKVFL